jgi:hypothetical protein
MKNKQFLIPMLISGIAFAFCLMWLISEIWMKFVDKTYQFDWHSVPTFGIALFFYGLFYIMYYGKSKYIRRVKIIQINKTHGITKDSQTPILLKR